MILITVAIVVRCRSSIDEQEAQLNMNSNGGSAAKLSSFQSEGLNM
jgi:hypothetical protein